MRPSVIPLALSLFCEVSKARSLCPGCLYGTRRREGPRRSLQPRPIHQPQFLCALRVSAFSSLVVMEPALSSVEGSAAKNPLHGLKYFPTLVQPRERSPRAPGPLVAQAEPVLSVYPERSEGQSKEPVFPFALRPMSCPGGSIAQHPNHVPTRSGILRDALASVPFAGHRVPKSRNLS